MYGLEAINANNGWAISVVGITIVFSGLVMLSLVISQLHKVLALWEDPARLKEVFTKKKPVEPETESSSRADGPEALSIRQKEEIQQFSLLARSMASNFSLPRLLNMARISGLDDPYGYLNILIERGIVVPDHEGFFTWDDHAYEKAVSG